MDVVASITTSEFEFPSHQLFPRHELGAISSDVNLYLSAGLTAIFTSSSFNALDCLRVRWQLQAHPSNTTLFQFASRIIRTEGFIVGLWRPGITANALGMGSSAALRFGSYEQLRDKLQALDPSSREVGKKSSSSMITAGLICGAAAYCITTPFHLLKTCLQAERALVGPDGRYCNGRRSGNFPSNILSETRRITATKGIMGLYKGFLPLTIRGSLFTGGQMFGRFPSFHHITFYLCESVLMISPLIYIRLRRFQDHVQRNGCGRWTKVTNLLKLGLSFVMYCDVDTCRFRHVKVYDIQEKRTKLVKCHYTDLQERRCSCVLAWK